MTFEVQQNRWDQTIRRASGSIGPGSRVAETLAELFPVFDVENLPAELLFLSGWRIGMAGARLPASVGDVPKIQLFNPVASGHIVTVTRVLADGGQGNAMRATVSEPILDTDAGGAQLRDTRVGVSQPSVAQLMTELSVTGIVLSWTWISPTGDTMIIEDENSVAVLAPGTGYTIATEVTNKQLTVSFFWRERPVLESEVSF